MTRRGKKPGIYLTADEQGSEPRLNVGYISDSSKEKFVEEIEGGQNDRISQLPDPILQRILCYLSTKQVFQSSTLSKSNCLEELTLIDCRGFHEFRLASRSIKKLSLDLSKLRKAAIDVPTMRCFELSCVYLPSISFTAASSEWKSKIIVKPFDFFWYLKRGPSSILIDVYQLHKAVLCHSEFSLHIESPFGLVLTNVVDSPVVVETLTIDVEICVFPLGAWLGHLFKIFRPRNIHHIWYTNPENDSQGLDNLLVNCLREFLSQEQLLMEEEEEEEADNRRKKIRFRLKWREGNQLLE